MYVMKSVGIPFYIKVIPFHNHTLQLALLLVLSIRN